MTTDAPASSQQPRTPKKIVIVQDRLRNGGTERQSLHLARTLAESGCDVTLLTFRPGGALGTPAQTSGLKLQSLQPFDTHLDFFAPNLHRALRRLAPGIVLCMGRMANCKAGGIARAFPGVAVISTMRTGKKLPRAYVRSLHATRHTIANSHEAARVLRERYAVPAEKITVIHNALVMECGISVPLLTDRFSGPPTPLRLLCSAMFRPEKNHRELIELFSRLAQSPALPAIELHLIGDGPELAPCRALAQRLNIADRVHFHGFVANPAPFYQHPANTIAVLTSQSESLPNFLVEAHAHSIPSVAYAVGGVAECSGITITPGDQTAFLAALENLIRSPAARATESSRVAAHAREHFSPETQLQRYLTLFDKLTT